MWVVSHFYYRQCYYEQPHSQIISLLLSPVLSQDQLLLCLCTSPKVLFILLCCRLEDSTSFPFLGDCHTTTMLAQERHAVSPAACSTGLPSGPDNQHTGLLGFKCFLPPLQEANGLTIKANIGWHKAYKVFTLIVPGSGFYAWGAFLSKVCQPYF